MIPMLTEYFYCRKKQCTLFVVLTRGLTANYFLVRFAFFLLVMYACIILDFLCINTIMDYCQIHSTCSNKTWIFTSVIHTNQTYCMFRVVKLNWEKSFLGTKLSLFGIKFIKMFVLISKLVHLSNTWNTEEVPVCGLHPWHLHWWQEFFVCFIVTLKGVWLLL